MHILNYSDTELKHLILQYTKSTQFISCFGIKNIENIQIDSVVNKNILTDESLTDNQFYFTLCNSAYGNIIFVSDTFLNKCHIEYAPSFGPDVSISHLPNNEILLFNQVSLVNATINVLGYLVTIN